MEEQLTYHCNTWVQVPVSPHTYCVGQQASYLPSLGLSADFMTHFIFIGFITLCYNGMFNYLSLLLDCELFEDWVMSILFTILSPELITIA